MKGFVSMENLEAVLESTYLKTAVEAQLTESENLNMVVGFVKQAITHNFVLVMLRPQHLTIAKDIIIQNSSSLRLGTVIDFPLGISDTYEKIKEAEENLKKGAFTFEDYLMQIRQMKKMGGMEGVLSLLPGVGKVKEQMQNANVDEKILSANEIEKKASTSKAVMVIEPKMF